MDKNKRRSTCHIDSSCNIAWLREEKKKTTKRLRRGRGGDRWGLGIFIGGGDSHWFLCYKVPILIPRARSFLVTWFRNEGLWKEPLPNVRKFLTSGCACAEVTNITAHAHNGFLSLTAPLGKNFTSWTLSWEWLLWDVLKMHHFTQLGFTYNLENLKKTVTETGWTHCWFAELTQLIGRLSSELCECFLIQSVWRTNTGKAISRRSIDAGKSQSI